MEYEVLISQTAHEQICQCIAFVNNVSHEAALSLYETIMKEIKTLSNMPGRCPKVDFIKIPFFEYRKLLIDDGRYAAIFRIESKKVFINYFVDLRKQDFKDIL